MDVEVIQEPTCGEDGSKEQECSTCHETQIVSIPATGNHNFVDGVCTVCGALDQWDGETAAEPAADEDGVYLISSGAELAWFRDTVNGGQYSINAKLTRNINLGENAWTAIGGPYSTNAYAGTFDGRRLYGHAQFHGMPGPVCLCGREWRGEKRSCGRLRFPQHVRWRRHIP